jgi:hypothetical protein
MIIKTGLHPITVLDSIPKNKLQPLLERDIVTCARLKAAIEHNSIDDILNDSEIRLISEDIQTICQTYGEHHN